MGKKAITTVSYQVTFELPEKVTLKDARDYVKDAIQMHCGQGGRGQYSFDAKAFSDVKIHLVNKETSYGKR